MYNTSPLFFMQRDASTRVIVIEETVNGIIILNNR